ncbi:DUF6166 domain-containing protein [Algihabitans albus]|uniref:DUF6166 domain-containing protein n=1 Tax=Algihabitans albus TaxID=2164067 RepID=UPI0035CF0E43
MSRQSVGSTVRHKRRLMRAGEASMKHYCGDRTIDGIDVTVDGRPLEERTDLLNLSRNGFEWGYEGPEAAQLALAILADHHHDDTRAKAEHAEFMVRVVANFGNEWEMTSADIDTALDAMRSGR